jgi:hypothetical protein
MSRTVTYENVLDYVMNFHVECMTKPIFDRHKRKLASSLCLLVVFTNQHFDFVEMLNFIISLDFLLLVLLVTL